MRVICALMLAAMLGMAPVRAESLPGSTAETRTQADRLLTTLGTEKMIVKMLDLMRDQMVKLIQSSQPGMPASKVATIVDEVIMPEMKAGAPELRGLIGEVWAANFSVEELQGLQTFYSTPLGRRVLELQPLIVQQSFQAGSLWGQRMAKDAFAKKADELARRGVKL